MSNVELLDRDTLMGLAQDVLKGQSRKAEMKVVYAKRPMVDANTGQPLACAGWVTWIDNDTTSGGVWQKVANGWKVLTKYGNITAYSDSGVSPWEKILRHRDGPLEFPVNQLLEFGWYDPERVPVQGVRFPQLRGEKIKVIPCPDCTSRTFLKPLGLAIHCRNTHNYDRADIQALGRELGIDFAKEMYKDRPREFIYDYSDQAEEEAEPEIPPEYEVETITVTPRSQRLEKPAKRPMSDEQKQVLRDRLAKAREAKAAKA